MTVLHFLHPEEGLKIVYDVQRLQVPANFKSLEYKGMCEVLYKHPAGGGIDHCRINDPIILPEDEMRSKYPELYI